MTTAQIKPFYAQALRLWLAAYIEAKALPAGLRPEPVESPRG